MKFIFRIVCHLWGHKPKYGSNQVAEWMECSRCGRDVSDLYRDWVNLK